MSATIQCSEGTGSQQPMLLHPSKKPKKRVTMIKHMVGKVRTTSHSLPEGSFVFGVANKYDEEGAGKVIQSWAQPEPSKPQQTTMRSFPATNREALRQGCYTAKAQREFAKQCPIMKSNPNPSKKLSKKQEKNRCQYDNDEEYISKIIKPQVMEQKDQQQVFGIKSVANDIPMKELLRCCAPAEFEEKDYPDRSNMQKKGRIPPAKSTKASRLLETSITPRPSREELAAAKAKENFKMKKFIQVNSKVKKLIDSGTTD